VRKYKFLCENILRMSTWGGGDEEVQEQYHDGNWTLKGKFHHRTCHEGPEEVYNYNSTHSLTSALDKVGLSGHAPAA